MDRHAHVAELQRHGEGLAEAARVAGLAAPVPTCPGWDVRELVRHTGAVHRWATAFARGRTEPWEVDLVEVVGAWPDDEKLLAWFRDGHRVLVESLQAADPQLECWTFLPAPSPVAMWARRQAHETAIHRADAELAGGGQPRFSPAFAADGIDELVACFVTRPWGRLRADPPRALRVRTDDAAGDWLVTIGPDGVETTSGPGGADCAVTGPASDLYLVLWSRRPPEGLAVEGDRTVLDLFLDRVHVRWA